MARGNFVLGVFDHLTFEFLNAAAFQTDEMVMVFDLDLIARDPIIEMSFCRETGINQELHRPINRCVSDIGMQLTNGLIKIFTRDVLLGFQEHGENQLALLRMLQMILFEIGTQGLDFDFVRHVETISLPESRFSSRILFENFFRARGEIVIEIFRNNSNLSHQPRLEAGTVRTLQPQ